MGTLDINFVRGFMWNRSNKVKANVLYITKDFIVAAVKD